MADSEGFYVMEDLLLLFHEKDEDKLQLESTRIRELIEYLQENLNRETLGDDPCEQNIRNETIKEVLQTLCLGLPVLSPEIDEDFSVEDSGTSSSELEDELDEGTIESFPAENIPRNQGEDEGEISHKLETGRPTEVLQEEVEHQLWNKFLGSDFGDSQDESDVTCSYSESSSSEENDSDPESNNDLGQNGKEEEEEIATFPYLNSDSESELEESWESKFEGLADERKVESDKEADVFKREIVVVTLDYEFDTMHSPDDAVNGSKLSCIRCPAGKGKFKDRKLYLIHCERHISSNHFVCPICVKPFTLFSTCLAHEVRAHDQEFPFKHPRIIEAENYVKERELRKTLPKEVPMNSEDESENEDIEPDEDDPKFYPNYAVPSTALYPYRGPALDAMCESYEVQLNFGRKKRTGVNTIAHVVSARRYKLMEQGRIPETGNQFWKLPDQTNVPAINKKNPKSEVAEFSTEMKESRKRPRQVQKSDLNESKNKKPRPVRKKGKKRSKRKQINVIDRRFVTTTICHKCQLCSYVWKTEEDLRAHRDKSHPKKTVLELMTVRKEKEEEDEDDEEDLFYSVIVRAPKEKEQKKPKVKKQKVKEQKPSHGNVRKESFLKSLGLVSVKKNSLRKKSRLPFVKPCKVMVERLKEINIPRSGRVFLCNLCSHFSKSRDLMRLHKQAVHEMIQTPSRHRITARRRLTKKAVPKKNTKGGRLVDVDVISLSSSSSSGSSGNDNSEDKDWRLPSQKAKRRLLNPEPSYFNSSSSSSSTSSSYL